MIIDLSMTPQSTIRLIVTRDRLGTLTDWGRCACDLFVCTSRISGAACFEHAIAFAAKRVRSLLQGHPSLNIPAAY